MATSSVQLESTYVLHPTVDLCKISESETVLPARWPLNSTSPVVCPGWHPHARREAPESVSVWEPWGRLEYVSSYLVSEEVLGEGGV